MDNVAVQITTIIDYICTKLGIAFDWTADNVMPYLTECMTKYTNWKTTLYLVLTIIGGVLLIGGIVLCIVGDQTRGDITVDIGILYLLVGVPMFFVAGYFLIKIVNFPELCFIEWATKILK